MATRKTYYDVLKLDRKPSLSADEVKQAYRKALLLHHPDKASTATSGLPVTVDDIALAYKTLSEPRLRDEYDRRLDSFNHSKPDGDSSKGRHAGLETVDLDDLAFDSASDTWTRGCRCGDAGGFTVSEHELEKQADEGEISVGCKGCSLWLRILFGTEG